VAAVQAAPVFLDRDATVAKAARLIADAATGGARLVAFPETWVPGYPGWIFGAAGWEDPASKRAYARLQRNAVEIPSPAVTTLCHAAAEHGVQVVIGVNELDAAYSRGTLYNSQLFITADGVLAAVHRKLMPTHAERIVWGLGDGSTLHVLETPLGRIGGLICWEHWMPLARFALHARGEQVHVAAWPEGSYVTELASRAYAFEGRCFVISANPFMTVADLPADFELSTSMAAAFDDDAPEGVINSGGSGVVAPDGQWVVGPVYGEERLVYADIDLSRIAEEQQVLDTAGHYNRPDVFALTVDTRPRHPLSWTAAPNDGRTGHAPGPAQEREEETHGQ
jgi:predicted amidohydrolase